MAPHEIRELIAYPIGDRLVVHAPAGRGEELRLHLQSHGVRALVSPLAEGPFDRLEVEDVDPETLQTLLDQWER
jgi:hypothetical protein